MAANLRELAYTHIRGKLLGGRIPPGTRISSRALAREIGISFIPVREAIAQLAIEGLVDHEAGVGTFATRVQREDLRELYELREALELHAVVLAAAKIDAAGLARMQTCIDEMRDIVRHRKATAKPSDDETDLNAWGQADMDFHMALLTAAGNSRLVRAVGDLRVLTQVFRAQRELRPIEDLERACQQHESILAALARNDGQAARAQLCDHIRFACANALDSLGTTPRQDA